MNGTRLSRAAMPWWLALLTALAFSLPLPAKETGQGGQRPGESFYIVSNVNLKKNQLFLMRPTQVTEMMVVTSQTVYLDATGHRTQLKDLRAGSTVYVTATHPSKGLPVATRIREGPMTVEELHRRYLNFR